MNHSRRSRQQPREGGERLPRGQLEEGALGVFGLFFLAAKFGGVPQYGAGDKKWPLALAAHLIACTG